MPARHDVSSVALQGGYIAKQCPVRAQNEVIRPCDPATADAFQQRLFEKGNAFEAEVVAELLAEHDAAIAVEGGGEQAEAATLAAMQAGARLILNGRLRDDASRRVGKPDLLVRCSHGGYHPVDVKWHMTLEIASADRAGPGVLMSPLDDPSCAAAREEGGVVRRRHEDDVLQLAHYRRMLEAAGMAAADAQWAGIIGVEGQVTWHDLDVSMWRTPSVTQPARLRTTMERYDFEFDFRLDIIAVAERHLADPSVDLLVAPVRCSECPTCPWNPHCQRVLETPPGDVSLLPRVGWTQWKAHRDRGVTNRAELAALDTRTAQLVSTKVDVAGLIEKVEPFQPSMALGGLQGIRLKTSELQRLADAGITTVGDLRGLDTITARYSSAGLSSLPEQIDMARAALGQEPIYRRRGVDHIVVPRADVEVDVDMENTDLGVYLWGTLVSRSRTEPEYVPFVTWEPLTSESETANSLAFWQWLMQLRAGTRTSGQTFAAYCWNAPAENQYLRRLGRAADLLDEVEAFITSDGWVDLLKVWDRQLITGGPSGLKAVAPLAGVEWTVDDPGGGESMVRYDAAVLADGRRERDAARQWLLEYNFGDVQATSEIRRWLSETGAHRVPSIAAEDSRWAR
jgi:predicted RecB family nuclease